MKSFFEEYGFVILAAIVVILLIAMCTPIGNLVKSQITGIVDSFANKTNTKLNAVDAGENTAYLRYDGDVIKLDVSSANSTDKFTYIVHGTASGQSKDSETGSLTEAGTVAIKGADYDKNSSIQVEVHNTGTGEVFYSNSITVKTTVKNPA